MRRAINGAVRAPAHGGLGEHQRLVACSLEDTADDLFGVAQAVDRRGIDPVDAHVEGAINRGHGLCVVLGTPGEFPVATANGPCAKANGGEVKVRVAEGAKRLRNGRSRHHNWLDDIGRERLHKLACCSALEGCLWALVSRAHLINGFVKGTTSVVPKESRKSLRFSPGGTPFAVLGHL